MEDGTEPTPTLSGRDEGFKGGALLPRGTGGAERRRRRVLGLAGLLDGEVLEGVNQLVGVVKHRVAVFRDHGESVQGVGVGVAVGLVPRNVVVEVAEHIGDGTRRGLEAEGPVPGGAESRGGGGWRDAGDGGCPGDGELEDLLHEGGAELVEGVAGGAVDFEASNVEGTGKAVGDRDDEGAGSASDSEEGINGGGVDLNDWVPVLVAPVGAEEAVVTAGGAVGAMANDADRDVRGLRRAEVLEVDAGIDAHYGHLRGGISIGGAAGDRAGDGEGAGR